MMPIISSTPHPPSDIIIINITPGIELRVIFQSNNNFLHKQNNPDKKNIYDQKDRQTFGGHEGK